MVHTRLHGASLNPGGSFPLYLLGLDPGRKQVFSSWVIEGCFLKGLFTKLWADLEKEQGRCITLGDNISGSRYLPLPGGEGQRAVMSG